MRQKLLKMNKYLKTTILATSAFLCLSTGYIVGYFQGYLGGVGHPAMTEAYLNVKNLEELRENKTEYVIKMLELNVDNKILINANYRDSPLQLAKIFDTAIDDSKLKKTVAAYREKHPSLMLDPQFQELIKKKLSDN